MRTSKRQLVLDAALELLETGGAQALTFEALAGRTGMTKGGIIYHFRTRGDLLAGVAQEIGQRWHAETLEVLGKPFDEATPVERIAALVRSSIDGPLRPTELALFVAGGAERESLARVAQDLDDRWTGDPAALTDQQRIALLAANGLWMKRFMSDGADQDDADLVSQIVAMACGSAAGARAKPSGSQA